MLNFKKVGIVFILIILSYSGYAQETISDSRTLDRDARLFSRKAKRDSIRSNKKVWLSVLGGPSYTPEASLGIGGAVLASFKTNRHDTVSQRSYIPAGINLSINGTVVVAGAGTLFFNENRFRIIANYGFRREPTNFYGVGFSEIDHNNNLIFNDLESDSRTSFDRTYINLTPKFLWNLGDNIFLGGLVSFNYNKILKRDSILSAYVNAKVPGFKDKFHNLGLGAIFQYDTRNDVATPTRGLMASAVLSAYGKYLGGDYNYEILDLEYKQFQNIFKRRSTLAWVAKSQIGMGKVPFTEMPTFGSPFDLRGYTIGKYRDKSMLYSIVEYRHMFGSEKAYQEGRFYSKLGFVLWTGAGTIGKDPTEWKKWKPNYGMGIRIQIQPNKNFRIDFGGGPKQKLGVYMNMTEAF